MDNLDIRFSIVVPVYNCEKYLLESVNSVLNQNFINFEMILVDDGSTDDSGKIIDDLEKKDSRIRAFHQNNQGSTGARKTAVKYSSGEYIISLDSDDLLEPGFLSKINDELSRFNNPSFLAFGLKQIDESGKIVIRKQKNDVIEGFYDDFSQIKKDFMFSRRKKCINTGALLYSICTKAIKRDLYVSCIEDIPSNINFGDDLVLTKLMLDSHNCNSIAISDYCGYCYRVNGDSMVHSGFSNQKLEKYETSIIYFKKLFHNELQKVYLFALSVLINQLSILCVESSSYKEFSEKSKEILKFNILWENACKFDAKKFTFFEKMKVYVIKYKLFRIFYTYFSHKL